MKISFDPKKDQLTRQTRDISLALGAEIISNASATTFGYVGERLFVCVFTMRDVTYHIISVRKANDREVAKYGRRL
jgi:uncharacterized protein